MSVCNGSLVQVLSAVLQMSLHTMSCNVTKPFKTNIAYKTFIDHISVLVAAERKERIVANLANFAYDPYNYTFLRQVNTFDFGVRHICL